MLASRSHTELCRPGDLLVVVHEFVARSPDELSLKRGDRVELVERDDDFGDGWFLGKNTDTGDNGLFPEVYTRPAPKPTAIPAMQQRLPAQLQPEPSAVAPGTAASASPATALLGVAPSTEPLHIASPPPSAEPARRVSLNAAPRSISMALSGDAPRGDDEAVGSPVMHETLSVINEHITGMSTPRHGTSAAAKDPRANDSGSEYSSHHRLSYVNGHETDEEEQNLHTEDEVRTWSPARVADYLEDVGVEKKHCDVFREQEIDGEALLGVDRNFIFMKEFDLGPMGPRLRTWMKVNALQLEVRSAKETAAAAAAAALDAHDGFLAEPARNRASSTGSVFTRSHTHRDTIGSRGTIRHAPHRSNTSAGHSISSTIEPTSPLVKATPASPSFNHARRPSAASVRSLNHNRRHSSNEYLQSAPYTGPPLVKPPSPHKKAPSFDRNWTMGSPQKSPLDPRRPSSSHHSPVSGLNGTDMSSREGGGGLSSPADIDRGYFSGGEADNRKAKNLLRKKESPSYSRNSSYAADVGRHTSYNRRHSKIASAESMSRPASPAAMQYYGITHKTERSSSAFEYVRPLKPASETNPTVTKLSYDNHSIDAIANSPHIPGSETSSTGRASPSPAAQTHSYSFFGKRARAATGLRAISDAITGGERANASAGDVGAMPKKDSPVQSPTRTGSSTPSGTSVSKSLDLEKPDLGKRFTGSSATSKDKGQKKAKKHGTSAYLKGRQQITPQEAMQNCDYSGWMKKKSSSLMTTWKSRLFVLRGRRLSYYYSEDDTEEKGLIDISSHRVLPANDERMTGLHATITRAASSPSSPHNATIQTTASANTINGIEDDMEGMFIFKLVPPRAGLQRGVQFTKPIVHYFAVDSLAVGRLWMAALMKATIDRDESAAHTTTYQQKTISLEKAQAMRQRPPNLMDDEDSGAGSERKSEFEKESVQGSTIHEEDEKQGLAIAGLRDEEGARMGDVHVHVHAV